MLVTWMILEFLVALAAVSAPFSAAVITTDYSSSDTRFGYELVTIYKSKSAMNDSSLTRNVCATWCQSFSGCVAYSYYFRFADKLRECKIGPSSTSIRLLAGSTVYSKLRTVMFQYSIGAGLHYLLYPNPQAIYPSNALIWWCIEAPPGMRLTANTSFWDVEPCCDYVDAYDGCDANKTLLKTYRALDTKVVSTQNMMAFMFFSDYTRNYLGFEIDLCVKITGSAQKQKYVNLISKATDRRQNRISLANAAAFILLFAPFTAAAITTDYSSSNTRLNQELAVIYKSRSARNDETLTKNVCAGWCQAYPGCTAYSYYFRAIDKFAECKIGPSSTSTKQRTGATISFAVNLFGGEVCELQKQCNTSSMMSCVNNVCTCPSTHTLAMDGQQCLPLVGFNESCKEQQQCPTSSSCLSALCQCDPGTTLFYGELPCVDSGVEFVFLLRSLLVTSADQDSAVSDKNLTSDSIMLGATVFLLSDVRKLIHGFNGWMSRCVIPARHLSDIPERKFGNEAFISAIGNDSCYDWNQAQLLAELDSTRTAKGHELCRKFSIASSTDADEKLNSAQK
ncbi:unnamed protein product [Notodromas monacha]|uniref:Uncharacterized protein n=1 Tax=Notodromas monacha TaxID=399045 RepID=A0A7R9GCM4_9CRUS|nr:unnamed protein product [Notodromas monacha]CAG0917602.1 unnamed protein product [Notodromas monacha]